MYKLTFGQNFWRVYKKLTRRNIRLKKRVVETLKLLAQNPKDPFLSSHKVSTKKFGERWSSNVTGDIRIIWDYSEKNELEILVLSLGGHSGKRKVYK